MHTSAADLVPMFTKELELCRLHAGETVGIFTEGGAWADYADAFAVAAGELGASVFHLDLPRESWSWVRPGMPNLRSKRLAPSRSRLVTILSATVSGEPDVERALGADVVRRTTLRLGV